jgi:hypothetical protein
LANPASAQSNDFNAPSNNISTSCPGGAVWVAIWR